MKVYFVTVIAFFSATILAAQERKDTTYRFANDSMICSVSKEGRTDIVFTKVQEPPVFPGGQTVWKKYVENNFKPVSNYRGIIEVWFIVELDGTCSSIQIIAPSGLPQTEQKSILQFFSNSGKWYPARQNGYCVRAWNRIQINN